MNVLILEPKTKFSTVTASKPQIDKENVQYN